MKRYISDLILILLLEVFAFFVVLFVDYFSEISLFNRDTIFLIIIASIYSGFIFTIIGNNKFLGIKKIILYSVILNIFFILSVLITYFFIDLFRYFPAKEYNNLLFSISSEFLFNTMFSVIFITISNLIIFFFYKKEKELEDNANEK